MFGLVASDPTVSRMIDALAGDAPRALAAINTARAAGQGTGVGGWPARTPRTTGWTPLTRW